ncbi:MAG: ABC transporter ATP-binding protein [Clostridium sp.]
MKKVLEVKNIQKYYGNEGSLTKAIDDISIDVMEGEFVGVMGPSGSGKTTFLNCISTIDAPTAGSILVGGNDITKLKKKEVAKFRREQLGFVFQDFNLLDTLSVNENIALALTIMGDNPNAIDEKVKNVAKQLGIEKILKKFPYEISGGQKQRVASARALITNPTLILADEPTGALDSKSAQMLLETFQDLNEKLKSTIIMVTHDAFSASYCKKIVFIKDGKIFTELERGSYSRKEFFDKILDIVSLLGGNVTDVR